MPRPRTECHFSLHIESGEIYSPKRFAPTDRILEPGPTLRFELYYPFTNPKWVEETHAYPADNSFALEVF